ncbi:hypothetical protein SLOPH_1731 [Spraguea lophii 42_110]|uniref:DUF5094 domain-containing protein n=1 Tax=Spraguea lophii (strain 42_110) TaxID=1358809 RepID=S7W8Z7_SPRLO|nr:hypothetical protein SLOPH_1731 [Spraguea lophii 42_110]
MKTPRRRLNFRTPTRKKIERPNIKLTNIKDKNIESKVNKKETIKKNTKVSGGKSKKNEKVEKIENIKINKDSDMNIHEDDIFSEYKDILYKIKDVQQELIENYIAENNHLRVMKKDVLHYKKFIGWEINDTEDGYQCTYDVEYKGTRKMIKFLLIEEDDAYEYKLIENVNVDLPEYLADDIWFGSQQLCEFFYSVMRAVLTKVV